MTRMGMRRRASIRARVWGLCSCTIMLLVILLVVDEFQMKHLRSDLLKEAQGNDQENFQALMEVERQAIESYVYDLTWWDDMVEFVRSHRKDFGDENIADSLDTYGLDAGWVLSPEFKVIYHSVTEENERFSFDLGTQLPSLMEAFVQNRFVHFYARVSGEVYELFGASIHSGDDESRTTPPEGYFLVARCWNKALLDRISCIVNGGGELRAPFESLGDSCDEDRYSFSVPLLNLDGTSVGYICVDRSLRYLRAYRVAMTEHRNVLAGISLFLSGFTLAGLYFWVLFPLKKISQSLSEESVGPLSGLLHYEEIREMQRKISTRLRQCEELKVAREQVNIANQAKLQFLRNLNHELNTPLNGIICAEQLLETTELQDEQREYLAILQECGHKLHSLIEQLLTLSAIESGAFELSYHSFDLQLFISDLCRQAEQKSTEEVMFVACYEERKLPDRLVGDVQRLQEALMQILENAFKFTHRGEVQLCVAVLNESVEQINLRFEISDTGIGIPEQRLDELMEMFTQADYSDVREYEGLGIGLALVRAYVLKMNGNLAVSSVEGKGTIFCIDVPFVRSDGCKRSGIQQISVESDVLSERLVAVRNSAWME